MKTDKVEIANPRPIQQFEEDTKLELQFFSKNISFIDQDMIFSHLPEYKREQILNIVLDYV